MEAKVAPAAPAPSAAAPAGVPPALDDSNFLLLAEFAHVYRDTLALRGIHQVQQFLPIRSTIQKTTGLKPKMFSRVVLGQMKALGWMAPSIRQMYG